MLTIIVSFIFIVVVISNYFPVYLFWLILLKHLLVYFTPFYTAIFFIIFLAFHLSSPSSLTYFVHYTISFNFLHWQFSSLLLLIENKYIMVLYIFIIFLIFSSSLFIFTCPFASSLLITVCCLISYLLSLLTLHQCCSLFTL